MSVRYGAHVPASKFRENPALAQRFKQVGMAALADDFGIVSGSDKVAPVVLPHSYRESNRMMLCEQDEEKIDEGLLVTEVP